MSIAIVTGAASGMGRACSERFIAEGWKVAALDRAAVAVDGALSIQTDITDPSAVGRGGGDGRLRARPAAPDAVHHGFARPGRGSAYRWLRP